MSRKCPVCRTKIEDPAFAPFCSKRCADVDLSRWLSGVYAVAAVEEDDATDNGSNEDAG